jgi:hypothetical protein
MILAAVLALILLAFLLAYCLCKAAARNQEPPALKVEGCTFSTLPTLPGCRVSDAPARVEGCAWRPEE